MDEINQGYDWQKFHEALLALVSSGTLHDRLSHAKQAIDLLSRKGVSTTPKLLDLYESITRQLSVLDTLPMDRQEALAKGSCPIYAMCLDARSGERRFFGLGYLGVRFRKTLRRFRVELTKHPIASDRFFDRIETSFKTTHPVLLPG